MKRKNKIVEEEMEVIGTGIIATAEDFPDGIDYTIGGHTQTAEEREEYKKRQKREWESFLNTLPPEKREVIETAIKELKSSAYALAVESEFIYDIRDHYISIFGSIIIIGIILWISTWFLL
jgi:hypothetical protein